jgi:cyanophycinase-like exopeptidase
MDARPGLVALFGSGETSPAGRRVHEHVFERLGRPIDVAILDTPAGFETNARAVAERIKLFLEHSLQNFRPTIELVSAPRADAVGGTNDAAALAPLLRANYLFAGPGSPSYAVRHLSDSLALRYLRDRWLAGAAIAAASAAAIALGRCSLPVYEIFKAGHDPTWLDGLDLLGERGLELAIVPHWNNAEGGRDFDSSHCFMGDHRFAALRAQLPPACVVLGIDEQTGCVLDLAAERAHVLGAGAVTVERGGLVRSCPTGETFPLAWLRSA